MTANTKAEDFTDSGELVKGDDPKFATTSAIKGDDHAYTKELLLGKGSCLITTQAGLKFHWQVLLMAANAKGIECAIVNMKVTS